jgi:hypothetical protein
MPGNAIWQGLGRKSEILIILEVYLDLRCLHTKMEFPNNQSTGGDE